MPHHAAQGDPLIAASGEARREDDPARGGERQRRSRDVRVATERRSACERRRPPCAAAALPAPGLMRRCTPPTGRGTSIDLIGCGEPGRRLAAISGAPPLEMTGAGAYPVWGLR